MDHTYLAGVWGLHENGIARHVHLSARVTGRDAGHGGGIDWSARSDVVWKTRSAGLWIGFGDWDRNHAVSLNDDLLQVVLKCVDNP